MDAGLERDIEVTAGSPKVARAVKDGLERLSDGSGGPELQEIARDLLDGRITLGDLTRTRAYSVVLMDQLRRYREWQANLSAAERARLEGEIREMYGPSAVDGLEHLRGNH
ncbi:hypothetical protein BJY16_007822 [Actinoplanes octamycinicus]|uniref:Uncharacterized protein n=1 Tax=Actinoplanes octamycinicus TaxID=135948 RepID=A0A7W7MBR2_9ACTN|nr:hypothetical protein [Actinoplanes octamycinicus]MBB4744363.1 hypothetical protein [Actinoplanes octamycinicus]GIE56675.1 hypothetical protein Aoc01nite_20770 [Actinoplanes octamycinicus]